MCPFVVFPKHYLIVVLLSLLHAVVVTCRRFHYSCHAIKKKPFFQNLTDTGFGDIFKMILGFNEQSQRRFLKNIVVYSSVSSSFVYGLRLPQLGKNIWKMNFFPGQGILRMAREI